MTVLRRIRRRLADERGFTLIEMLVTLAIGTIVLLGAYTLADAVGHAQTRISDRSESIARGRTAMEQLVQQLRSQVCLGPGYPAIAYGDANEVTFYADLADTTFVPQKRDIKFSAAAGTITETDYTGAVSSSTTGPPFTFSATPARTRVILDHVKAQVSGATTLPFFTYYSFDGGNPVRPANLLATPLGTTDIQRVVQISVNFSALPSRGGSSASTPGEPFTANVFVRTADPTDPDHSPLCI
jgi:prepilin-type N-terminal cleavage/methylation domain-containing protein